MASTFDADVTALAKRIAELGSGEQARVYRMSWWSDRMLGWAMSHPSFKTQLFRFVDVFPATSGDADVLRHVREYFDGDDVPRALDLGVGLADHLPFGGSMTASVARRNIRRMAEQFIVGTGPEDAVDGLHRLWRQGSGFVVDLLGEKTVTEAEADRYAGRMVDLVTALLQASAAWAPDDHLERDDLGPLPRVAVSIKPTALATHYGPLTGEDGLASAKARLRPILKLCAEQGAYVWFDMEHLRRQGPDPAAVPGPARRAGAGVAGRRMRHPGLHPRRPRRPGRPDRLVVGPGPGRSPAGRGSAGKGRLLGCRDHRGAGRRVAVAGLRAQGRRPTPTTSGAPGCCTTTTATVGPPSPRTTCGRWPTPSPTPAPIGIPDTGYELQMLYGMAEPVQAAIRRLGLRLRVYAPVGELVPGMAYLVRRLLENTSNDSFVRMRFSEDRDIDELVAAPLWPRATACPGRPAPARPAADRSRRARAVPARAGRRVAAGPGPGRHGRGRAAGPTPAAGRGVDRGARRDRRAGGPSPGRTRSPRSTRPGPA